MKAAKRILFIALMLTLVIAITACGSNNASPSKNNTTSQKDNSTTKSNSTTDNTSSKQKSSDNAGGTADTSTTATVKNLNGRTIRIAAYFDASPKADSVQGKELIAQQKKVEKEYNVKIKYMNIPYGDVPKKLTSSVLAGKPFADMVRVNYAWSLAAAGKKEILPISSFAPDMTKYKNVHAIDKMFGNNYGFDVPIYRASGIWYNREIFKKLNLPDPHQLYKNDKWTWSDFEKLAQQATVDNNGDGKNDTWGVSGSDSDLLQFALASNNAALVDLTSGKATYTDPKVVQSLDFERKLWNKDHVWKVEPKSTPDNWKERDTFKDGDVAMAWGYGWEHATWKNIDTGFVPFPKGPSATDWSSPLAMGTWVVPAGVKNPEDIIAVYNALQDIKPTDDYPGQSQWEQFYKHQDDIDVARMLTTKLYAPPYHDFDAGKMGINDILTKVVVSNQSTTSVLKQHEQQAQSIVDAIMHPKS